MHTPTNVEHDELKIFAAIAAAAATMGTVNMFGAAHRRYNQMVSTRKDNLDIPREFGHKMSGT